MTQVVGDFIYDANALHEDATGYGIVLFVATGRTIARSSTFVRDIGSSLLSPDAAATFLNKVYALVRTARELTIYRFYGNRATDEARMLGSFWSPARPSLAIDGLGYESWHNTSRADLALVRSWNPMRKVVEAQLASNTLIYCGRAAPQMDGTARLGGGAIQFLLPEAGHSLHLTHAHLT